MKRSRALNAIANQIDFIEGKFCGVRDSFSEYELSRADVILSTLEGMKIVKEWEPEFAEAIMEYIKGASE